MRRNFKTSKPLKIALLLWGVILLIMGSELKAQILFAEDCFVGGVTVAGVNRDGGWGLNNKCVIKWEDDYELYRAYVCAYRYGRPEPHSTFINGTEINWNNGNQAGPEQLEDNIATDFFAPHAVEITNILEIDNDTLVLDFPQQMSYDHSLNWAWCSMYVVILYTTPDINTSICNKVYIADQRQDNAQVYNFNVSTYNPEKPVLLSLFTSRLTQSSNDYSSVFFNNTLLGNIKGYDLVIPPYLGAQGSFYYEGDEIQGLNGDTTNAFMGSHDATARINEYLTEEIESLTLFKRDGLPDSNLHPAFTITYTPECPVADIAIERAYTYCRGGEIQLGAEAGYDNYEWTPAEGLSDVNIPNPICSRDSSGWYQVRMYNDPSTGSETTCSQTIPVHIEVTDYPQPENTSVAPSVCPQNTGAIVFENVPGALPIAYKANDLKNSNGSFTDLAPGEYDILITTAHGCAWDTSITILQDPIQEAAFTANPETGFSPLSVFFDNESTQISTGYQWLIDGQPISTNENLNQLFPDSGIYEIGLIAYYQEETCADTAFFTLIVYQGLTAVIPNIITPNGDGRNDALVAKITGASSVEWEIYNRWGNSIHNGSNMPTEGELELWAPEKEQHPDGVYTVVITIEGDNGQVKNEVIQLTVVN